MRQNLPTEYCPQRWQPLQYTSWKNPQNSCGQTNNFRSAPNTSFTKNMTQKQKLPTKIKRVSGETVHILRSAEGGSVFPLAVYNSRCYLYGQWRLTGPLPQSPPPLVLFCVFSLLLWFRLSNKAHKSTSTLHFRLICCGFDCSTKHQKAQ